LYFTYSLAKLQKKIENNTKNNAVFTTKDTKFIQPLSYAQGKHHLFPLPAQYTPPLARNRSLSAGVFV